MPSWNIHLEAGERLASKLKFSGFKRKKFLLGCILPDINNGYINRVKVEKPHDKTHYSFDKKSSLNFYAEYKDEVDKKDPICLGYLFHLYTDGFFNYDFYRNIKKSPLGEGLDHVAKRKIKHHDFWIYDTNFHHRLGLSCEEETEKLARAASKISAIEISPSDIEDVERILLKEDFNNSIKDKTYTFYTEEKLNQILDNMIESFTKDYLGEKNA